MNTKPYKNATYLAAGDGDDFTIWIVDVSIVLFMMTQIHVLHSLVLAPFFIKSFFHIFLRDGIGFEATIETAMNFVIIFHPRHGFVFMCNS
jgi:hypothetical protein